MPDRGKVGEGSLHSLELKMLRAWPPQVWAETRIVLAISGGADSVALVRAMIRLAERRELLVLAHFNHGWRDEESERDERFVRQLGEIHGLCVHVAHATEAERRSASRTEENARQTRYEFLSSVAYKIGARYVLTAHTASDRVETILHNLFRGTGLAGIHSLELTRPLAEELLLVRPMLHVSRAEVEQYLEALEQPYCDDSSNANEAYRRNFLRQSLLPAIRERYGAGVDAKLLTFSGIVAEVDSMLRSMSDDYLSQIAELTAPQFAELELTRAMFAFPNSQTLSARWPVVRQALQQVWQDRQWPLGKMTYEHWKMLRDLHVSQPSDSSCRLGNRQVRGNLPGDLQVSTSGPWIILNKLSVAKIVD